ncbi:MAG TPA: ABC transporter ATP-binding protein [Variovorax sp.]|jgi:branched-chain amino acid transport system ATP-binding protein|nr:ABC transporter ATP-binding protein [Variovorax sp.]
MTATLVLQDVARHFGGVPAVDKVSLQVPAGQITGLIGPNGAGKTTVVNLITGLLHLSSGKVLLDGRDVSREEAPDLARAGVARTFQNIRLVPDASVLENVVAGFHRHEKAGLWANLLGLPSARAEAKRMNERAMALLERFGMTALAEHRAGGLSYGHQRRIEMMRALATEPRLLLLDEPVAGMNDAEAESLAGIFRSVAASGVAVLLIEHNMRFVMSLCSHLYVLASGRLIAEGQPDAVGRDPMVVEAYLGA